MVRPRLKPSFAYAASAHQSKWWNCGRNWELVLLVEKKRLELQHDLGEWVVAEELRFTLLGYCDPGDRFLVATAKVYGLTLVTANQRLQQIPDLQLLANR